MSEHAIQASLMTEVALRANQDPVYDYVFAVPNGGHRDERVADKLKAEGVKAGVPDLLWPLRRGNYVGLAMELKWGRNKPTLAQSEWLEWLALQGWFTVVVYDRADVAMLILRWYEAGADPETLEICTGAKLATRP